MHILSMLPLLASDVGSTLKNIPDFDFDKSMDSIHSSFHLRYVPGAHTVNFFGSIIKLVDTIGVLILVLGLLWILFSSIKDNGRWRRVGYYILMADWAVMVFSHFMIAGGMSYKTFFGHWKDAVMIILTQIMLFAIPTVLYYQASSNLEFYELTSDVKFQETATKQFRYMVIAEFATMLMFVILGVVL